MKLKHVLLAAGAAALLGWGGCRLLAPSPEARVRAAFSALAACLDKRGADEGPLRTLAKREELAGLLDDTVTVTVRELGWTGTRTRGDAASRAFAGRQHARTLRVRFDDLSVRVAPNGLSAETVCDATVAGDSVWGGAREDVRAVRARLVRKGGRWLFSEAEVVPIVSM